MSKELKPCPFCGGNAELFYSKKYGIFFVECLNCDATHDFNTRQEAIDAWNRRAIDGNWKKS